MRQVEVAVFAPEITDMLLNDPDFSERIKLSERTRKMLREHGTVRGLRMETLAQICKKSGMAPGEVIVGIQTIEVEANTPSSTKTGNLVGELRSLVTSCWQKR